MNVVVLGTNSLSTWMVVNALRENYPDICVAIEKPISRVKLIQRRIARLGVAAVVGQLLFMLYISVISRMSAGRIRMMIQSANLTAEQPEGVLIKRFDSVNSADCIDWLRAKQPMVVILNGTRIVSPALLESCNAVFLNIHCGITPAYRGVHGGYWALACGDHHNVGVTIHVVDAGVDTGQIVFQQSIQIDIHDSFVTYPFKQYIAGIPLMQIAVSDAISGQLRTYSRNDLPSVIRYHPTLWKYLWTRARYGVG